MISDREIRGKDVGLFGAYGITGKYYILDLKGIPSFSRKEHSTRSEANAASTTTTTTTPVSSHITEQIERPLSPRQSAAERLIGSSTSFGGRLSTLNIARAIYTSDDAQESISEFEELTKGLTITINKPVFLTPSKKLTPQAYINAWLSNIIRCYVICGQLDKAEKYIDFALEAVTDTQSSGYSQ